MEDNIMLIKAKLENINKRINKIEDDDADFAKNERWIALDKERDKLYAYLAKLEAEYEKSSVSSSNC